MTAVEYREYVLLCDRAQCRTQYRSPGLTQARLRRKAAGLGWTHVRSDRGWRLDGDYCPAHQEAN